jgi:hypothetical protein
MRSRGLDWLCYLLYIDQCRLRQRASQTGVVQYQSAVKADGREGKAAETAGFFVNRSKGWRSSNSASLET